LRPSRIPRFLRRFYCFTTSLKGAAPIDLQIRAALVFYLQQPAGQLPQQSDPPSQQPLHLSVQQAGQQSFFADWCDDWANALTARTTATARTEIMRFIK
jgi:hypothetical protein